MSEFAPEAAASLAWPLTPGLAGSGQEGGCKASNWIITRENHVNA